MNGAGSRFGKRAIVVGGSLAGTLAARVLAQHFERVLVLERDELPSAPAPRRTTPQAQHIHILLKGGENAIEALVPGFCAELEARGAETLTGGLDVLAASELGVAPRWDSGMRLHSQSRWLLEHVLRTLVLARAPNVELRTGVSVRGLARNAAANRVTGVVTDAGAEPLAAELVIDATGRREEGLRWLEALGIPAPPVETVEVDFGYASAVLELADEPRDWKILVAGNLPRVGARGAVILPIEGGRFMISAGGRAGDYPPDDEAAFIEFCAGLPQGMIGETLRKGRFASPIARMIYPANRFRHYERHDALPLGLLPLGDALCSFNPTYGQGMSSAAFQAKALAESFAGRSGGDALREASQRHLAGAAEIARNPWRQANYNDFLYPTTQGDRAMFSAEEMQYRTALQIAALRDPLVRERLNEVGQLLAPFETLLAPEIRQRVAAAFPAAGG
jgi:flavin-dependent dehydrogenase